MTESEIRQIIVDALEYASVFALRDAGLTQSFLNGDKDARLDELEIDSLAIMELCIALEINAGASVVPADIAGLASLDQLVRTVLAEVNGEARVTETLPPAEEPRREGVGIYALYQRLRRYCHSVNQVNRAHVLLENRMTPQDIVTLLGSRFDEAGQAWMADMAAGMRFSRKPEPEPFERVRLAPNINFYSAAGNRADKTLAICFTGHAQRMMMPLPMFLQTLDASKVDVLLLRDCRKSGYRNGIKGTGDSIEQAIDMIGKLLPLHEWQRGVTIGISGGGIPAVIAALRLSLDNALSVGGNNPDDTRWKEVLGEGADEVLRRNIAPNNDNPSIYYAFGSDAKKDKRAGQSLQKIVPTKLVCIGDDDNKVGHVALDPLLRNGLLGRFLDSTAFKV